jgi:uncharacterized protein
MHSDLLLLSEAIPAPSSAFAAAAAPLAGGMLIGLAAALLLGTLGRIAGISGILGSLLPLPRVNTAFESGWRVAFLLGLLAAGFVAQGLDSSLLSNDTGTPVWTLILAGLLVGFGTRLGSGCTSGHGVCGISRLSPRSIAATLTFIFTGALTVTLVRILGGES